MNVSRNVYHLATALRDHRSEPLAEDPDRLARFECEALWHKRRPGTAHLSMGFVHLIFLRQGLASNTVRR